MKKIFKIGFLKMCKPLHFLPDFSSRPALSRKNPLETKFMRAKLASVRYLHFLRVLAAKIDNHIANGFAALCLAISFSLFIALFSSSFFEASAKTNVAENFSASLVAENESRVFYEESIQRFQKAAHFYSDTTPSPSSMAAVVPFPQSASLENASLAPNFSPTLEPAQMGGKSEGINDKNLSRQSALAENRCVKGAYNLLATTTIAADLLRQIGGKHVCVESLMGTDIDPHAYVAKESDARRLLNADAVFYHGLHLEAKMAEWFEKMGRGGTKPIYNLSSRIPSNLLLGDETEFYDPHVWFDVSLWQKAAEQAALALMQLDAAHASIYRDRAVAYLRRLSFLHEQIKQAVARLPRPILATSHDAFSYFAKAYGMEVVALKGINTQTQTGIKNMQYMADVIVAKKAPAIFTEATMPKKEMQAIANAVALTGTPLKLGGTLYTDALGSAEKNADTYEKMMRYNLQTIISALGD